MNDTQKIAEIFHAHGDIMSTAELSAAKIYYADIQRLLTSGAIEKIKRGCYHFADNENPSEADIILRLFPDAVLCLDTALFYHRYSDRTPGAWHLAVDKDGQKSRFKIDYPFVQPYYLEPNILKVGIMNMEINETMMKIYDKERTICDLLKREKKTDKEIFNKAIQSYINDNTKNIPNLMSYAKAMRITRRVKDLIGVWL